MENWLSIAAGVYLLVMILHGHYRGFIRLAVSMVALVLSLGLVHAAMPTVTQYLKNNTTINQVLAENMKNAAGVGKLTEQEDAIGQSEPSSVQRMIIEGLNLPENVKTALIDNNTSEVYELLGVNAFADYIGNYLADMVLNTVGFVLLFILVYLAIRLVMGWLDLLAKLPVLSGINQIAGALLGAVEGLVFLWILCLVLTACSGTAWGMDLIRQVEASPWLSFLYTHNFLNVLAAGILRGIL